MTTLRLYTSGLTVRVRRRWFPWGSDSVTLGRTIWTRLAQPSTGHLRHELGHVLQQQAGLGRFLWRYLTSGTWRKYYEFDADRMAQQPETEFRVMP